MADDGLQRAFQRFGDDVTDGFRIAAVGVFAQFFRCPVAQNGLETVAVVGGPDFVRAMVFARVERIQQNVQAVGAEALQVAREGLFQTLADVAAAFVEFAPVGQGDTDIETAHHRAVGVFARKRPGFELHGHSEIGQDFFAPRLAGIAVGLQDFCEGFVEV